MRLKQLDLNSLRSFRNYSLYRDKLKNYLTCFLMWYSASSFLKGVLCDLQIFRREMRISNNIGKKISEHSCSIMRIAKYELAFCTCSNMWLMRGTFHIFHKICHSYGHLWFITVVVFVTWRRQKFSVIVCCFNIIN